MRPRGSTVMIPDGDTSSSVRNTSAECTAMETPFYHSGGLRIAEYRNEVIENAQDVEEFGSRDDCDRRFLDRHEAFLREAGILEEREEGLHFLPRCRREKGAE